MPVVVIEVVTEAPSVVAARAMLDACSAGVREVKCELARETAREPHLATATVKWFDSSEHAVRIEVRGARSDASAPEVRVLTFKETDAHIERWRAVGLTIATLVGDALPATGALAAEARFEDATATPGTATAATDARKAKEKTTPDPAPVAPANAAPTSPRSTSRAFGRPSEQQRGSFRKQAPLPRTFWTGVSVIAGPGLEQGSLRLGAAVDASFRPTALPVFGRIGLGYASRGEDSRGLSVQWETVSLGVGAVVGDGALRLEPRLALGIENVRAAASDEATGRSDSRSQLGASVRLGLDGVWQIARLAFVAGFEGWQSHAATRIIVEDRDVGTAAATSWELGVGARYYIQ
jgi:hypothetical protein